MEIDSAYNNRGTMYDNFNKKTITSDDLDRMARQINNEKKNRSNDIYKQYRNFRPSTDNLNSSVTALDNMIRDQSDKSLTHPGLGLSGYTHPTGSAINGFFSAQGDYAEYKPIGSSPLSTPSANTSHVNSTTNNQKKKRMIKKKKDKFSETNSSENLSLDTPSDNSNSSSDSDSSFEPIPIKKKRRKRHKCIDFDLDSIDSLESLDSGESLLRHIQFCRECKNKIMDLIKKHRGESKKKSRTRKESDDKCSSIMESMKNIINEGHKDNINSRNEDYAMRQPTVTLSDRKTFDRLNIESFDDNLDTESVENSKKNSKKNSDTNSDKTEDKTENYVNSIKFPELRDIITVCLIGFIVIVVLDLLMRSK